MLEALILWKLYADADTRDTEEPSGEGFILLTFFVTALLWPGGIYFVLRRLGRGRVLSVLAASAIAAITMFVIPIYVFIVAGIFIYAVAYFADK